ncbi:MAG: trehalose-phosphatase [Sphingomonadaceae bacterium]
MARPGSPPPELPADAALFLDFDGTLVELADHPHDIEIDHVVHGLLEAVADHLGGRLAIVSGRSIADLDRFLGSGGYSCAGSHGLERRRADGMILTPDPPRALPEILADLKSFAGRREGLLVEEKPMGAALHYRLAPEMRDAATRHVESLAERHGLAAQTGKMMIELRPPGSDKGDAIAAFMDEPPFAGARPFFAGDDVTDEDGFRAVAAMKGAGILVGPERESAALHRLSTVDEVHDWLARSMGVE